MTRSAALRAFFLIALASGSAAAGAQTSPEAPASAASQPASSPLEIASRGRLQAGADLLQAKQPARAIAEALDPVIADYDAEYRVAGGWKDDRAVYCSRGLVETLFYLAQASTEKRSAVVLSMPWADAYYLKAYALIDLRRLDEARMALDQALALSPRNAQYRSESGQLDSFRRDWVAALGEYRLAEQATDVSPPETKTGDLGRALRGQAFVDVELKRLDEAEALYLRCLELDPNDTRAKAELGYVRGLRKPA